MDKILVTAAGIILAALTYWFFLRRKEKEVVAGDSIEITVQGGYSPEVIVVPVGRTTKLNFMRLDESACLEEVVLGDFKIRKTLPLRQKVEVEIKPEQAGEFTYSCGMGMYHGKIKAK